MSLENLVAWWAQVCILTAVAACAVPALKTPRARLFFWQAILAAAPLLPLLQPRIEPRAGGDVSISTGPATSSNNAGHSRFVFRREDLAIVIAAGIALRLLWMAVGFARLRRHRLAATAIASPPFDAPRVRWYLSETVSGPVTFGWLRPSILLPTSVERLAPELREAIARHELIHVERGDWMFVVVEELIRAALWFHPAVWLVLSRIQLSREQTVDAEVVHRTRDRDSYLNALVAVAEQKFSPAPLFLKKRQLALRVAAVLEETNLPKSRVMGRFAAVFSAALLAARVAMWFFPMQGSAQTTAEADDPAITVDAGAPLLHRAAIHRDNGATGTVIVEASVDRNGLVNEVRAISGPDGLRQDVLESVAKWHYATDPAPPPTVRISVNFDALPRVASAGAREKGDEIRGTVAAIRFVGIPPQMEQQIRARLPFHEGDQIGSRGDWIRSVRLQDIDQHLTRSEQWSIHESPPQVVVTFSLRPGPVTPSRIRISGNVQAANLVKKVVPEYPPDAKAARVQGVVRLTAIIGKDGRVSDLQVISGDALLTAAAMEAVKQWEYRPTLLNGNPIEVITAIDVNFTLSQ